MDPFTITQPMPGVFHIQDVTGVCFTLVTGERESLLWDTGVGLYDVAACIAPYVRGKLHVVLSHGHYDHACGQHYFSESVVHPYDLPMCRRCVGRKQRSITLNKLRKRGLLADDYPSEQFLNGTPKTIQPLTESVLDLGVLEIRFIPVPGHTSGSIAAYIPERSLILTGDSWNPQTWLFFPESCNLVEYTKAMRSLRGLDAMYALRPHDITPVSMDKLRAYIDGLNENTFETAQPYPIPPYAKYNTVCCYPEPDSMLVFNSNNRG